MVYLICMMGDVVWCLEEWYGMWWGCVVSARVVFDRRRDFEGRAVTCFGGLRHEDLCKQAAFGSSHSLATK
jgi:hypothetical protein